MTPRFDFSFASADGLNGVGSRWNSQTAGAPRAVIQIAHGMTEQSLRYGGLVDVLTSEGFKVYANRGHGRTATAPSSSGDFSARGLDLLIDDMWHLSRVAKGETPGVPFLLLGHGIGSFAAQLYVLDYSSEMAGLVLSTSGANDRLAGLFTTDPLCFAALQPAALESFLGAAMRLENQFESRKIRKGLPILLISSGEDPVGKSLVGVEELARRYRKAGLGRVTERVYRDGQHDIFDEIQHGQAHRDLLGWLGCVLGPSSSVRQHGPIGERP